MKEPDIAYLAELVILAQKNDSDAFAELYSFTYKKVYNYCRYYLRDDYLAQDAMQEVYILALKSVQKLNDPCLFTAWLNRISFHVCYDISKKQPNQSYDPDLMELVQDENTSSNPEVSIQTKDEYKRLNDALDQLPFQEKQVLVMRFYNNMKLEEIASAMDISRSSVKRYISSGQEKLKRRLAE